MTFRSVLTPVLVVFVASVVPAVSKANINLYTFETPLFTNGDTTPIAPTAPNSGDPSFTTSFADAGDPGGATIAGGGFLSPLFSGQFLVTTVPGVLTLTFNEPVYALQVAFALDAPISDSGALLQLVTPSTTFNQFNTAPGGNFAGGILTFSSTTPFTTATLDGIGGTGAPTPFAIDNLSLSTSQTPEPSFLAVLGAGLAGLVALRRRKSPRQAL